MFECDMTLTCAYLCLCCTLVQRSLLMLQATHGAGVYNLGCTQLVAVTKLPYPAVVVQVLCAE